MTLRWTTKNKLKKIIALIRSTYKTQAKNYYIIGVSGGIDSCLCLCLLANAIGLKNIKAFYLPIDSNYNEWENIALIEKYFEITIEVYDLSKSLLQIQSDFVLLNKLNRNIINNQKPKLRSMFLSSVAMQENGLVVSCLNYDEYFLGYFTKFGDSNGDIYPLINFTKTEINQLAQYFNLPPKIINQAPSAGLYLNQTDENEFGFSYQELDRYLTYKKVNQISKNKIKMRAKTNMHKRILKQFIFKTNMLRKK